MNIILPMAGLGSRYVNEGFKMPKPLITIDNQPMFINSLNFLSKEHKFYFVFNQNLLEFNIEKHIKNNFQNFYNIVLTENTEGQASTCLSTETFIEQEEELLIAPCDSTVKFNNEKFKELKKISDCIVFTFKNNMCVNNNPNQDGWVNLNSNNEILNFSIKKSISNLPTNDNAIVGIFWYKKSKYFFNSAKKLISENIRINGEFYVDESLKIILNSNLKINILEVDQYICWGTPNDFYKYNYWKRYFNNIK